ncbi:MAG: hypothetical protein R2847_10275 [Bacteroidia bacterium]
MTYNRDYRKNLIFRFPEIGYGKKLSVRDVVFITVEPSGIICRDTADNLIQESACNDVVLYIAPIDSMLTSPHDAEVLLGILSAGPDDQNIKNNLRIITSKRKQRSCVRAVGGQWTKLLARKYKIRVSCCAASTVGHAMNQVQ